MPAQASQSSELHVAGLDVVINGSPVSPEIKKVIVDVRVQDVLSLPCSATIRISDPEMKLIDKDLLAIGKELEIKAGAIDSRATTSIFKGEIVALEPDFSETNVEMVVRAYDKSHRLQRGRAVRTYQQVTASDIVTQLCQEAGLAGRVDSTSGQYQFFMRKGETPRELIARFEHEYDYRFWVENGSYRFKKAAPASTALTLKIRENLMAFRPRASAAEVSSEVTVKGWNPKQKQAVVGVGSSPEMSTTLGGDITPAKAKSAFGEAKVFTSSRSVETQGEAQTMARALANRKADSMIEAEGTAFGDPKLRAGTKVKIEGVGTRFGGEYVVSSATHVHNSKGYKTHFRVSGASTRGLLDLMRAPERRDWSQNLVIGVVTNVNDPDALGRVKLKFPALPQDNGKEVESDWARIATLAASNKRGVLMLPELGDEVVVGFENGDPRRPFVLGAVFNGRDKPDAELLQDKDGSFAVVSNKKAFMHSKEDMTFKSDKAMLIEVTNDQTSTVKGKVEQNVSQGAKLKAGTTYEVEAGSSMKLKGVSVTVEATASLTLKGATVDVQASGPLNLKGAIINIG
jgi:uncharacterized protein involved in type VI secretion and phage assembly